MRIVLLISIFLVQIWAYSDYDLNIRRYDATSDIGVLSTMIEFGGDESPICKLAISNDGKKFFFKEVKSKCKIITKNGERVVCTPDKKVCKSYKELREAIRKLFSEDWKVYHLSDNKNEYIGFLSLREGPSKKYREIDRLYNGDKVKILSYKKRWYKIKVIDKNKYGWVYYSYLEPISEFDEEILNRVDNAPDWCDFRPLSKTDMTICSSEELSRLANQLEKLYIKDAELHNKSYSHLQEDGWFDYKDRCKRDIKCIKRLYIRRINRLKRIIYRKK